MARRDEAKRKRRQKRISRGQPSATPPSLRRVLTDTTTALSTRMPTEWPGASDPALTRPDMAKFRLATFIEQREPGKSKLAQLERNLKEGPLGEMPHIEHWAMEEFFYHGLPGDSWHPIEAYLAHEGESFSPAGQTQLRRWKEARIGLYVLGEVRDDTIAIQEWDPLTKATTGPSLRAISLNIGGVNGYRRREGMLIASYVAPWAPEQGIVCAMGYALMGERDDAVMLAPFLGLRRPDVAAHAWPWNANRSARQVYLEQWEQRDWQSWLRARLVFPFHAFVPQPPDGKRIALQRVTELVPSTPFQAREMGIYFVIPNNDGESPMVCGATNIKLFDLSSPNLGPLSEYQTYREWAGPPPGTRGAQRFRTLG